MAEKTTQAKYGATVTVRGEVSSFDGRKVHERYALELKTPAGNAMAALSSGQLTTLYCQIGHLLTETSNAALKALRDQKEAALAELAAQEASS